MNKIVLTCPDHKGYKLTGKKYCKKCQKYREDAVEAPPSAPKPKIDLEELNKVKVKNNPTTKPKKEPTNLSVSEVLKLLPPGYRNPDLCPSCNPVPELKVCTNKYPVATGKILDGWTAEEMVTYLQGQFNTAPETNAIGQAVRPLVKAQIIKIQSDLGIHKLK